jgi:hypothetical protein
LLEYEEITNLVDGVARSAFKRDKRDSSPIKEAGLRDR